MIKYSMIIKKNGVIINMVNLFFKVNNKFLIHKCENEVAEKYGDFLNFPESHMEIWEKFYAKKYHVDFDYFPRGRVVYNINEKSKAVSLFKFLNIPPTIVDPLRLIPGIKAKFGNKPITKASLNVIS